MEDESLIFKCSCGKLVENKVEVKPNFFRAGYDNCIGWLDLYEDAPDLTEKNWQRSDNVPQIGEVRTVKVETLKTYHPKHMDIYYPINYRHIKSVMAHDVKEQDAYILGIDKPVKEFTGRVIAVIHRNDDVEEKWVVAPENVSFTSDEIMRQVYFQEVLQ